MQPTVICIDRNQSTEDISYNEKCYDIVVHCINTLSSDSVPHSKFVLFARIFGSSTSYVVQCIIYAWCTTTVEYCTGRSGSARSSRYD